MVFRVDSSREALEASQEAGERVLVQPLYESRYYWWVVVLNGRGLGVMRRDCSRRYF
ncbi:hypothetical protein MUP65_02955 [Patescibacteria group bacterium]|nr:hypothetical protein [Patescibacteria group bacterium]